MTQSNYGLDKIKFGIDERTWERRETCFGWEEKLLELLET